MSVQKNYSTWMFNNNFLVFAITSSRLYAATLEELGLSDSSPKIFWGGTRELFFMCSSILFFLWLETLIREKEKDTAFNKVLQYIPKIESNTKTIKLVYMLKAFYKAKYVLPFSNTEKKKKKNKIELLSTYII